MASTYANWHSFVAEFPEYRWNLEFKWGYFIASRLCRESNEEDRRRREAIRNIQN